MHYIMILYNFDKSIDVATVLGRQLPYKKCVFFRQEMNKTTYGTSLFRK